MSINTQPRPHLFEAHSPRSPETTKRQKTFAALHHYSRRLVARLFLPKDQPPLADDPLSESDRSTLIEHMSTVLEQEKEQDALVDQEHRSPLYHNAHATIKQLQAGKDPDKIRVGLFGRTSAAKAFRFEQVIDDAPEEQ